LIIFKSLLKEFDSGRIIITDEINFENNEDFFDWKIIKNTERDFDGLTIIPFADIANKFLPVGESDFFIATAWWTAYNALKIQNWQKEIFKIKNKFIYLIQDYEPSFYNWSTRYALAESTYHFPDSYIPVFNSSLLKDYFYNENYKISNGLGFEPILNPELKKLRKNNFKEVRTKKILIYGRPSVDRNLFPIIVLALDEAMKSNIIKNWEILSAGEEHSDISLSNNKKIKSLGKLSLENYAKVMGESSVGISLMLSPHPSYPPLEMAAYGMKVITNKFKNKDLSKYFNNIYSIEDCSPSTLAKKILEVCQIIEFNNFLVKKEEIVMKEPFDNFLKSEDPIENLKKDLLMKLL